MHLGAVNVVSNVVASSAAMVSVLALVARLAKSPDPVSIVGDTGTGKSTIARLLHQLSSRAGHLAEISAAELMSSLAPDQLFGHERGAFTGADRSRKGLFGEAGDGSVFLDEFHLLKRSTQALLLRTLGRGEYRILGASRDVPLQARLIVATQLGLDELMQRRRLIPDLRWRLGLQEIRIPPLAERREDIAPLAAAFLEQCRLADGSLGASRLSGEALAALELCDWPGNVWELRAVVLAASTNAIGEAEIGYEHLPPAAQIAPRFDGRLDHATKRRLVAWALWRTGDRIEEAAALIGAHRNTVSKLRAKRSKEIAGGRSIAERDLHDRVKQMPAHPLKREGLPLGAKSTIAAGVPATIEMGEHPDYLVARKRLLKT